MKEHAMKRVIVTLVMDERNGTIESNLLELIGEALENTGILDTGEWVESIVVHDAPDLASDDD